MQWQIQIKTLHLTWFSQVASHIVQSNHSCMNHWEDQNMDKILDFHARRLSGKNTKMSIKLGIILFPFYHCIGQACPQFVIQLVQPLWFLHLYYSSRPLCSHLVFLPITSEDIFTILEKHIQVVPLEKFTSLNIALQSSDLQSQSFPRYKRSIFDTCLSLKMVQL